MPGIEHVVSDFDPDGCMVRIDQSMQPALKRDRVCEGDRLFFNFGVHSPAVSIALLHGAG